MAARVTQVVGEVGAVATPDARVTQQILETASQPTVAARVTQLVGEVGAVGTPDARVTQMVLEVAVSVSLARRRTAWISWY